jgi:tetratricopeptide (TPR) repeat protein
MESFSRVFSLDWTTAQNVSAVVGLLIVVLALLAFLRRRALRRQEEQSRTVAEQLAILIAGEMMARSQLDGDRFSLKEGNSIATLMADAVLALNKEDSPTARRAVRQLKSTDSALATEFFAELARSKLDEAERASRRAATALRQQGALTLPHSTQAALSLFQQALELDPGDAENLLALALVRFRQGDIASVEALIEKARQGSGRRGRADIAGLIDMFAGVLHLRRGRLKEAIEKFEAATRVFAEHGDPKAQVDALMALASAQMKGGQLDGALANYNKAAVLCNENKYELGLAQLYSDLGLLLQGRGQHAEAEQMLLKSFSLAERLGEMGIASVAAGNLALLYRETQDLGRAEEMVRQALQLESNLKHKNGVARANLNLGAILFEKGRFDDAASHFKESLRLYEALEFPDLAAQALFNLANVHRAQKQYDEAETCYRKSVDLFLSANDASGVARAAGNLGALYLDNGHLAEAEEEFNVALDAAREAGEGRAIAMQIRNLAVLAHARGDTEKACQGLRKSLALCVEIEAHTEALELRVLMGQIGCQERKGTEQL